MSTGVVRIALDGMGGDHAPREIVKGALGALEDGALEVILVGREAELRAALPNGVPAPAGIRFHHAEEVVPMHATFSEAWAAKDTSVSSAAALAKQGEADAVISAGNTGAAVAAAFRILGRLEHVERPAILSILPTAGHGDVAILDVGANVDCKPSHLLAFAKMGHVYMKEVLGYEDASVGLLNIGEESCKGNEVVREAYKLISESGLPFVGNVEGNQIFSGACRVVVCDGFVGNAVLKSLEGCAEFILEAATGMVGEAVSTGLLLKDVAEQMLQQMHKRFHYAAHGGALLLGVNGVFVICHGRSDHRAVASAIRMAARAARSGLVQKTRLAI